MKKICHKQGMNSKYRFLLEIAYSRATHSNTRVMWHSPPFGFLRNYFLAWVMPVVFYRQPESCVFSLVLSVMSPRWELSNETMDGFWRDLPTVLNKDGLCWSFHSECWSIHGGGWQGWQHAPKPKFPLPIEGRNSIYVFGECGLSLPQNSVNCFHTLHNNINFPQRSPFVIPVSDGVITGASKRPFLGSWAWSGGWRNPLLQISKLEKLGGLSHLMWIIQQVCWRWNCGHPKESKLGDTALVCREKENTDRAFERVVVWIQRLLKEVNTPIGGKFGDSIIG